MSGDMELDHGAKLERVRGIVEKIRALSQEATESMLGLGLGVHHAANITLHAALMDQQLKDQANRASTMREQLRDSGAGTEFTERLSQLADCTDEVTRLGLMEEMLRSVSESPGDPQVLKIRLQGIATFLNISARGVAAMGEENEDLKERIQDLENDGLLTEEIQRDVEVSHRFQIHTTRAMMSALEDQVSRLKRELAEQGRT